MSKNSSYDFTVVGGGIVGLATARQLSQQFTDARILLLEKERDVALHQSGRNSGVLHSGVYYKPGSLKSITCQEGKRLMESFCQEHEVSYDRCGKIIVATNEAEMQRLQEILVRGKTAGVQCREIDSQEIREIEPHAKGIAAVHVPEAGIVDFPAVCRKLSELLVSDGHSIRFQQKVVKVRPAESSVEIGTASGDRFETGFLVTCGGLYSDQLARMSGLDLPARIVPFRGEYYSLKADRKHLCRNLIYPVPDPSFPFLGVHFTRMINGEVECGPNAVLALAREGYSWSRIHLNELLQSISYRGFQRIAAKHWMTGIGEINRSIFKSAFVRALQRLIPEIQSSDLTPCRAGVRAQAIAPDGTMIDDFLWIGKSRTLHVCNAPSPAATASFEIARHILAQIQRQLDSHDIQVSIAGNHRKYTA